MAILTLIERGIARRHEGEIPEGKRKFLKVAQLVEAAVYLFFTALAFYALISHSLLPATAAYVFIGFSILSLFLSLIIRATQRPPVTIRTLPPTESQNQSKSEIQRLLLSQDNLFQERDTLKEQLGDLRTRYNEADGERNQLRRMHEVLNREVVGLRQHKHEDLTKLQKSEQELTEFRQKNEQAMAELRQKNDRDQAMITELQRKLANAEKATPAPSLQSASSKGAGNLSTRSVLPTRSALSSGKELTPPQPTKQGPSTSSQVANSRTRRVMTDLSAAPSSSVSSVKKTSPNLAKKAFLDACQRPNYETGMDRGTTDVLLEFFAQIEPSIFDQIDRNGVSNLFSYNFLFNQNFESELRELGISKENEEKLVQLSQQLREELHLPKTVDPLSQENEAFHEEEHGQLLAEGKGIRLFGLFFKKIEHEKVLTLPFQPDPAKIQAAKEAFFQACRSTTEGIERDRNATRCLLNYLNERAPHTLNGLDKSKILPNLAYELLFADSSVLREGEIDWMGFSKEQLKEIDTIMLELKRELNLPENLNYTDKAYIKPKVGEEAVVLFGERWPKATKVVIAQPQAAEGVAASQPSEPSQDILDELLEACKGPYNPKSEELFKRYLTLKFPDFFDNSDAQIMLEKENDLLRTLIFNGDLDIRKKLNELSYRAGGKNLVALMQMSKEKNEALRLIESLKRVLGIKNEVDANFQRKPMKSSEGQEGAIEILGRWMKKDPRVLSEKDYESLKVTAEITNERELLPQAGKDVTEELVKACKDANIFTAHDLFITYLMQKLPSIFQSEEDRVWLCKTKALSESLLLNGVGSFHTMEQALSNIRIQQPRRPLDEGEKDQIRGLMRELRKQLGINPDKVVRLKESVPSNVRILGYPIEKAEAVAAPLVSIAPPPQPKAQASRDIVDELLESCKGPYRPESEALFKRYLTVRMPSYFNTSSAQIMLEKEDDLLRTLIFNREGSGDSKLAQMQYMNGGRYSAILGFQERGEMRSIISALREASGMKVHTIKGIRKPIECLPDQGGIEILGAWFEKDSNDSLNFKTTRTILRNIKEITVKDLMPKVGQDVTAELLKKAKGELNLEARDLFVTYLAQKLPAIFQSEEDLDWLDRTAGLMESLFFDGADNFENMESALDHIRIHKPRRPLNAGEKEAIRLLMRDLRKEFGIKFDPMKPDLVPMLSSKDPEDKKIMIMGFSVAKADPQAEARIQATKKAFFQACQGKWHNDMEKEATNRFLDYLSEVAPHAIKGIRHSRVQWSNMAYDFLLGGPERIPDQTAIHWGLSPEQRDQIFAIVLDLRQELQIPQDFDYMNVPDDAPDPENPVRLFGQPFPRAKAQ